MIVIYTEHTSARQQYTFRHVFNLFLKTNYSLVQSLHELDSLQGYYIINYSNANVKADLTIKPSGWLQARGPYTDEPTVKMNGSFPEVFSYNSIGENDLGFDLFSAVFYFLSCSREYLSFEPDKHGRFMAKDSLAGKHGFLMLPVVDAWCHELAQRVNGKLSGLISSQPFKIINTIDVDNAFAFKGKSRGRTAGAFAKHLVRGEFSKITERRKVLSGAKEDPFNTYTYIRDIAQKNEIQTYFFHLVGRLAQYDRNISPMHPDYRSLLKELNAWSVQGLHPSYASGSEAEAIKTEKKLLEQATGVTVENSRQHFLKMRFPETYRSLLKAGIKADFSLGFAEAVGFRAGTGRPFYFYDLEEEKETSLLIQPLCIMDATLKIYNKFSPEEAIKTIQIIQEPLRKFGSVYVGVWHNETLGENYGWKGWRAVYESQFC